MSMRNVLTALNKPNDESVKLDDASKQKKIEAKPVQECKIEIINSEIVDPTILCVGADKIALTSGENQNCYIIGSKYAYTCVILIAYNSKNKLAFCAHISASQQINADVINHYLNRIKYSDEEKLIIAIASQTLPALGSNAVSAYIKNYLDTRLDISSVTRCVGAHAMTIDARTGEIKVERDCVEGELSKLINKEHFYLNLYGQEENQFDMKFVAYDGIKNNNRFKINYDSRSVNELKQLNLVLDSKLDDAIRFGDSVELFNLLKAGANPSGITEDRKISALRETVLTRKFLLFKMLLRFGAPVDIYDTSSDRSLASDGRLPLIFIIVNWCCRDPYYLKFLIELLQYKNVMVDCLNKKGETPLEIFSKNNNRLGVQILNEYFKQKNENKNAKSNYSDSRYLLNANTSAERVVPSTLHTTVLSATSNCVML